MFRIRRFRKTKYKGGSIVDGLKHSIYGPRKYWPEFLGSAEVASILHVNRSTAIRFMKQDGFPLLDHKAKRGLKVNKYRFMDWVRGDNE